MLVGRSAELALLAERLGRGEPLVAVGEAGIGKTTLLRAAATATGHPVFEGGGLSTLSWLPYLPIERALGAVPEGDPAFVAAEVARTVGDGVLLLDDLQWCDAGTLALLPLLVDAVSLLTAVRIGDPRAAEALEAAESAGFHVLRVEPLDDESAREIVRSVAPGLPPHRLREVVGRSGRNPLLLRELAASGEPSASLRLEVAARLRDAGEEARHGLCLLSLAGRPLERRVLGPVAEVLVGAGLALDDGERVEVRHALFADAALDGLDPDDRRSLHAELAARLDDPGEAARHLREAGHTRAAHRLALEAAASATTRGERAAHLVLAATCAAGGEDDLVLEAAEAALDARDGVTDIEALLDAVTGDDPATRGRVAVVRAWSRFHAGDTPGLRAAVADGLAAVAGTGLPEELRLRVLEVRNAVALDSFTPELLTEADRVLELARAANVDVAAAESAAAAAHYLAGNHDWAPRLERAMALAADEGDVNTELRARQNLVTYNETDGTLDEARRQASTGVERARALRCSGWERMFTYQLVNLDMHAGRYADVLDAAYAMLGEPVDLRIRDAVTQALVVALVDLGRFEEADGLIEWGLREASDDKQGRFWYVWFAAERALWSGRPAEALDRSAHALAWPGLDSALASFPLLTRAAACVELDRPLPDAAIDDAGVAMLRAAPVEHAGLVALGAGDHEAAASAFGEAAEAWQPYHRRGALRCRWAAAEALRRADRSDDAVERLQDLEAVCVEAHLEPLLGRVQRSLRLAGVRRVASAPRAADALSPRERQIVSLVASGSTNVEIARRLGVSRSTVAAQLRSASNKLGVTGRARLAAAVSP